MNGHCLKKELKSNNDDANYAICPRSEYMTPRARVYATYSRRWYVLSTVCLLALSNATLWMAFMPIEKAVSGFYCQDRSGCDVVFWCSQIFQLVGVVTGVVGMYFTDVYGIRHSCLLGSVFHCTGAVVRVIASLPDIPTEYKLPLLYTGQTIAAMAQPFFLCLSTKVAEYWFAEDQRALANSLSFIANPIGVVLGSIAPTFFVTNYGDPSEAAGLLNLNITLMAIAVIVLILNVGVRAKPPTPPSASSESDSAPPFFQGLVALFKRRMFFVQMVTFGMAFALQWSIFVTGDKLFAQLAYPPTVTSYLMALSAVSGSVGSLAAGHYVDKSKKFKEVIKGCYVGLAVAAISINAFLRHDKTNGVDTAILVILLIVLGFFAIPVFPISLELGVETTFPVAEATSSGVLIMAGQLVLFVLTFGMQLLESEDWIYSPTKTSSSTFQNYQLSIDFWTLCAVIGSIFACCCLWPRYRRLEFEEGLAPVEAESHERVQ